MGAGQLGRPPRPRAAAQPRGPAAAILLGPFMDGLATHTESAGNGGQRFPAPPARHGGQPMRFHPRFVPSRQQGKVSPAPRIHDRQGPQ